MDLSTTTPTPAPQGGLLQQYDREQQPGYHDGYEDGRLKGYEVGERHATDRLNADRLDMALLVNRLIRRLNAAREGKGSEAGDRALAEKATNYLRRKGLTSPLR